MSDVPHEIQWYLARYEPDLMRAEAKNIGVIVRPARGLMQYRFQDLQDARALMRIRNNDAYLAWVKFWTETIEKHGPKCLHWITKRRPGESYYLSFGGSQMATRVVFDELFDRLCGEVDSNEVLPEELMPRHWQKDRS